MIFLLVFLLHDSGDFCALTEFSLTFSAFLFNNLRLEAGSSITDVFTAGDVWFADCQTTGASVTELLWSDFNNLKF